MRVYLPTTVVEEAYKRVERIFREFDTVIVDFSGGKDSTVILNIALEVAEALNRLPLPVLFIDQEAEWQATIDYVKGVMYDPRVKPIWLQVEFKLFNSGSPLEPWLICWEKGKEDIWMREKDPIAIHEKTFKEDRFKNMFDGVLKSLFPHKAVAQLGGVRAEESPNRFLGLTSYTCYKDITWGRKNKTGYTFYPIYDWSYTDVWKFIFEKGLKYNTIYNDFFRLGIPIKDMRVSSLSHETALRSAYIVQEVEPKTWERLQARLHGLNTVKHLGYKLKDVRLPPMFENWEEYRNYLIFKLIPEEDQLRYIKKALSLDEKYAIIGEESGYWRVWIQTLYANDKFFTKFEHFEAHPEITSYRKLRYRGIRDKKYTRLMEVYEKKLKEMKG